MRFRFLTFVLAAMSILAASCSKQTLPGPVPHPVHGKVMYRGQPAKGFRVVFYPLGEQGKRKFAPSAISDEKGEFRLCSYHPDDGAPTGEYAVTFQWPQAVKTIDENELPQEVDRLQDRYSNPKTSRFKATVREGDNTLDPFVLQ